MRDHLKLTDNPLIDAGKVCWALSKTGLGDQIKISRYGAYDLAKAKEAIDALPTELPRKSPQWVSTHKRQLDVWRARWEKRA